jgi:hypothetical protein
VEVVVKLQMDPTRYLLQSQQSAVAQGQQHMVEVLVDQEAAQDYFFKGNLLALVVPALWVLQDKGTTAGHLVHKVKVEQQVLVVVQELLVNQVQHEQHLPTEE